MSQTDKKSKKVKWAARVIAVAVLVFGLPFYFGYGNPLPFINPNYTLWDNMWLTVFPIMFIGLAVGFKIPIFGGCLVSIPVGLGLVMGVLLQGEFVVYMFVPLSAGILYFIDGYKSN